MPWGKRPFSQKLLLPDEEIPLRLLEYSRFVIICFANISSLRTSFFHRRDVHNLKAHVRSLSACDVHEILGSVSDSQKTGTHAYHDQRNGILEEKFLWLKQIQINKTTWIYLFINYLMHHAYSFLSFFSWRIYLAFCS